MLAAFPTLPVIALGVWWNSNTVAHNFIHRPFFRARWANLMFSSYLSVLLGIPQTLWRERHLAHHAGNVHHLRFSRALALEAALILAAWIALAVLYPRFFLAVYLPGYLLGLALCSLQGRYEHSPSPVSHYGTVYNVLCFNDGYHAEHHANPSIHWSELPARRRSGARVSRWPAPLRWMEHFSLEGLERVVLRRPVLRAFVLRCHARAIESLLPLAPAPGRVTIVGGGLFPRTGLLLRELLPSARLTVVDSDAANLAIARPLLDGVDFVHACYPGAAAPACDLLVIPLSFRGDRSALEQHPPTPAVLIHDWIWRPRGHSRIVSWLLLKRLNLILQ